MRALPKNIRIHGGINFTFTTKLLLTNNHSDSERKRWYTVTGDASINKDGDVHYNGFSCEKAGRYWCGGSFHERTLGEDETKNMHARAWFAADALVRQLKLLGVLPRSFDIKEGTE